MFFDTAKQFSPKALLILSEAKYFLLQKFGLTPIYDHLFLCSLIHKSHARDYMGDFAHNERLEFLGDAVLGHVVVDFLYKHFPDDESLLALYKVSLIREETLANSCRLCGLDTYILLSHGEENAGGRKKDTILADCLEAFLGYISLDFGYEIAYNIVRSVVIDPHVLLLSRGSVTNAKSRLQEYTQKERKKLPVYEHTASSVDTKGNVLVYSVTVTLPNSYTALGQGKNKKQGEEDAARTCCELLGL